LQEGLQAAETLGEARALLDSVATAMTTVA
jgi:hypothetical protein